MALPNDSILVTPGAGATVATHAVGGKEYQVVMLASPSGHIHDSMDTYSYWTAYVVGAANKIHFDIFNASGSGKIVKVRKLFAQCSLAAITGVGHQFDVIKTSAVGTGGTALTGRAFDSANAAIPAQVTARSAATGGATTNFQYFSIPLDPEETRPGSSLMALINWLPEGNLIQDITLREGEGLKVVQITNNTAASWGFYVVVTLE